MAARTMTPDLVVETALRLADSGGLRAVTLSAVARELGCHITSLYTHVDSVDDLHLQMALATQRQVGDLLWAAALGRTRSEALRGLADVYRDFGERHPGRMAVLNTPTAHDDERSLAGARHMVEPIRATLRSFGLDDEQVLHAHRAFSSAIRGFTAARHQGVFLDGHDGRTFDEIVTLFVTALESGQWPTRSA